MPKAFNYHRSHAHRVACLSLYRALLRGANNFSRRTATEGYPIPSTLLTDLIRFRFRRDCKPGQSTGAVADALTTGRGTLEVLREAASLSPTAVSTLLLTLNTTSAEADLTAAWREEAKRRARPPPKDSIHRARHLREITTKRFVNAPSRHDSPDGKLGLEKHPLPLLDLPLRKAKLKRVVPHLVVNTSGKVPILRYKTGHGQPVWLRRIHAQEVKATKAGFALVEELDYLRGLGKIEDDWDRLIEAQARRQGSVFRTELGYDGVDWFREAHDARQKSWEFHAESTYARAVKGWELFQIVKREKWMADKESLPFKIASAIQNGQRLQENILAFRDAKYKTISGLSTVEIQVRGVPTTGQEDNRIITDELVPDFENVVDNPNPDFIFAGPDATDVDDPRDPSLLKDMFTGSDDQRQPLIPIPRSGTRSPTTSSSTVTPSQDARKSKSKYRLSASTQSSTPAEPFPSSQPLSLPPHPSSIQAPPMPAFNFTPRPKETSKSLIKASLALAPLVIPTEWSKKVVDKEMPKYLSRPLRTSG